MTRRSTTSGAGGPGEVSLSCGRYREIVSSAIDGEVDDLERALAERHLRACPRCTEFREFALSAGEVMRKDQSPSRTCAVDGRALRRAAGRSSRRRRLTGGLVTAVGASLMLGFLLGGSGVLRLGADRQARTHELALPRVVAARTLDPSYVPYLKRPLVASWDAGVIKAGTADEKRLFWVTPMSRFEESHYRPERL